MNLKKKLMILLIISNIIPVAILGGVYDINFKQILNLKVSNYSDVLISNNGVFLDSMIDRLEDSINILAGNDTLQLAINEREKQSNIQKIKQKVQIIDLVNSVISMNNELRTVVTYSDDGQLEVYGADEILDQSNKDSAYYYKIFKEFFKEYLNSKEYSDLKNKENKLQWLYYNGFESNKVYLIREIKDISFSRTIGLIAFVVDLDKIEKIMLSKNLEENQELFLLSSNKEYLISNKNYERGLIAQKSYIDEIDTYDGSFSKDDLIISSYKTRNNWTLISTIPKKVLHKDIYILRYLILISGLLVLLIAVFIVLEFFKNLYSRFDKLIYKMGQVKNGKLDIDDKLENIDEISFIHNEFISMVKRLKNLIHRNYTQRLEKQDAELKALQYQINPHFLYNTLEIINSSALSGDFNKIRKVSQTLGDLFRYNANKPNEDYVELSKEIEHIKNYVYLQKLQLDKGLEVFYDIDQSVTKFKIMRFILQPLVENSIHHGFSDRNGSGLIEINVYRAEDDIFIEIIDDGKGIDEKKLHEIKYNLSKSIDDISINAGIGLSNVNSRIKLAYGNDYGLDIDSKLNQGTTIKIEIPINNEL